MEDQPVKQTEFNSSQATLIRIDQTWKVVERARYDKNFPVWLDALDSQLSEVRVYLKEMPENFRQDLEKSRLKCNEALRNLVYCAMKIKNTYESSLLYAIDDFKALLPRYLDNYGYLIRIVMDKKQLLLTQKASASEAAYDEK